jgi:acyl carrier protein
MNRDELRDQIARVIAEITEIPVEKVTPEARLVEDLGAESMNALELLAALEKRFNIVIDASRMLELETLATSTTLVQELLDKKA